MKKIILAICIVAIFAALYPVTQLFYTVKEDKNIDKLPDEKTNELENESSVEKELFLSDLLIEQWDSAEIENSSGNEVVLSPEDTNRLKQLLLSIRVTEIKEHLDEEKAGFGRIIRVNGNYPYVIFGEYHMYDVRQEKDYDLDTTLDLYAELDEFF